MLYISGGDGGSFPEKTGWEDPARLCSPPPSRFALGKKRGRGQPRPIPFCGCLYSFLDHSCHVLEGSRPAFSFLCDSCPRWHHTTPTIGPSVDMPYVDTSVWTYPRYSLDFLFPLHFYFQLRGRGGSLPSGRIRKSQGPFAITQFSFFIAQVTDSDK